MNEDFHGCDFSEGRPIRVDINYELNAVLYSKRLAKELEEDFERDLAYCTEFDPVAYHKRHTAVRFRDSVARLLSPLL